MSKILWVKFSKFQIVNLFLKLFESAMVAIADIIHSNTVIFCEKKSTIFLTSNPIKIWRFSCPCVQKSTYVINYYYEDGICTHAGTERVEPFFFFFLFRNPLKVPMINNLASLFRRLAAEYIVGRSIDQNIIKIIVSTINHFSWSRQFTGQWPAIYQQRE